MSAPMFHIRLYTGPTAVKDYAERLRVAGYDVTCEGTEHVYFYVFDKQDGWGAIGAMETVAADIKIPVGPCDWSIDGRL